MSREAGIYCWQPIAEIVSLPSVNSSLKYQYSRADISNLKANLVYIGQKNFTAIPAEVIEFVCDVILFYQQVNLEGHLPISSNIAYPDSAAPRVFITDSKGKDYYLCELRLPKSEYHCISEEYKFLFNKYCELKQKLITPSDKLPSQRKSNSAFFQKVKLILNKKFSSQDYQANEPSIS